VKKILAFLILLTLGFPTTINAQATFDVCPKEVEGRNYDILCRLDPQTALPSILTFVLVITVILALLYLIWGGIKWITSGGDKGNVETARNQIVAVIVGLILVFLAWFIINFILQFFFGQGFSNGGIEIPSFGLSESVEDPTPTTTPTSAPPTPTTTPNNATPTPEVLNEEITAEEIVCTSSPDGQITCTPKN
jgi:hypothetical protein